MCVRERDTERGLVLLEHVVRLAVSRQKDIQLYHQIFGGVAEALVSPMPVVRGLCSVVAA